MSYDFEWPRGFLDTIRVEGKDKVLFDGFAHVSPGIEIPAYEFGVQSIWVLKVCAGEKDYIATVTVNNPGQYGNTATIHIYSVNRDGTLTQLDRYAPCVLIHFNGEGN